MRICGLQKLTLLDYPGKTACTVFTGGCNFRCPFCHNASLVEEAQDFPEIPQQQIFELLEKRRGVLDGLCLTGGEPLLQPGVEAFLEGVKARGFLVKLDTNGSYPQKLRALAKAKLVDYVAMDLKNSPAEYARTAGVPGLNLAPLRESAELLLSGAVDGEFRTTVVKGLHTAQSLREAAESIRGARRYYLQTFVDSGGLLAPAGLSAFSPAEMRAFLELVRPYVGEAGVRGV